MSKEIGKGSWDSIVKRYQEVYPSKEPFHYGTIKRWREGGSAPLDGNSVYDAGEFWHYITFGMSELYEKDENNTSIDISGWGFEFSFKLKKLNEQEPPMWVITILQKLAKYVFNQRMPFDNAHFISFGSAINPEMNNKLDSFIFSEDETIGKISSPTGCLKMLEVFCITAKDIEYCWSNETASEELIRLIRRKNPYLINDFTNTCNFSKPEKKNFLFGDLFK